MPKLTLPKDFLLDPMDLIRDPNWESNYPKIILRGIYNIMKKDRKKGRGSTPAQFIKAFNIIILTLAKKSHPHRIVVDNGIINLTAFGDKQNEMLSGNVRLDAKYKKRYGNKSKSQMQAETRKMMKELKILINIVRHHLADGQPVKSPTRNP
jgi:hypothetical protein